MFLAIDSSVGTSVAVVSPAGAILAENSRSDPRGHAENIGSLLQETLVEAGVEPPEITRVVMGVGPGPFTGLRVGMAAAEAFALSRAVPLFPLVSHDAEAWGAHDVVIVTDARRGEVAYSVYRGGHIPRRLVGPALARPDTLDEALGEHRAVPRVMAESISAGKLGQVAHAYLDAGIEPESRAPQYLRAPDVTVAP